MMPDNVALFATIILLLPMIYFLLAAPAFLLVKLDIPAVALLLRAMLSGYFLTVAIAGAIGTLAVAVTGRLVLAIGICLIAAFATCVASRDLRATRLESKRSLVATSRHRSRLLQAISCRVKTAAQRQRTRPSSST